VALWALASALAASRTLPGPLEVLQVLARDAADGTLWQALAATGSRVAAAFVVAMALGAALGYAMGRMRALDQALDAWLVLLVNLPALVIIILAYVWFGLNEMAAIGAVALTKLPNVVVTVREGARTLDPGLDAVARVYRFSPATRLREIILPQLQPYLAAAARTGLAMVWKIVLVVELLGRPNGVGFELHNRFQLFDVAGILAYALSFGALMLLVEGLLLRPMDERARAWRVGRA
jgi:NitT/TauT family transport system permease protein